MEKMYERQLQTTRNRRKELQKTDLAAYNDSLAAQSRNWRRGNPEGSRANTHRYEAKNMKEKKWYCMACDYNPARKPTLVRHLKSEMHAVNVARLSY